jgi:hypothetical protein
METVSEDVFLIVMMKLCAAAVLVSVSEMVTRGSCTVDVYTFLSDSYENKGIETKVNSPLYGDTYFAMDKFSVMISDCEKMLSVRNTNSASKSLFMTAWIIGHKNELFLFYKIGIIKVNDQL